MCIGWKKSENEWEKSPSDEINTIPEAVNYFALYIYPIERVKNKVCKLEK